MSSADAPTGQGLASRAAAWRVLQAVAAGAWADAALERELARHPLPAADRALATDLAYGAVRQRRLLDAWIDAFGRVSAERQPPKLRWLLHVGLYQLLFSQRVPPAAAVNTTVELARQGGLGRLGPVVNGLLRSFLRRREGLPAGAEPWQGLTLPADPVDAFGLRHSLPQWLAASLFTWLPPERAEAFARAANSPPALDLRVNRCRASREAVLAAFAAAGLAAAPLPHSPHALTLLDRPGDLRQLPGFAEGHWCVQDRSAQAIAPLLDPHPGERILDACAAPGGKATQLAELLGDQGEVWAVDRSAARLRRVQANAERLGLRALHPLAADAVELAAERPDWHGHFQAILLDAPCSGLGTLARHADARWRIDGDAVTDLAALQARLLEAMVPLLAPGGRLVYATCTVHPTENQARIAAFQAAHPTWSLRAEQQCWPGDPQGGDGFYAAVLEAP
jgi:16S rRNA (cytosine967-C5)-methyltransferase